MKKINISIMFAGQGTQYKEMTSDLLSSVNQETINTVLEKTGDFQKYKAILYKGLNDLIENGEFQQYLLLYELIQYAQLIKQFKFSPAFISGHSFGQFASYVVSKSITLPDMLDILKKREKLVKKVKNYSMAAVLGIAKSKLNQIVDEMKLTSISVSIVNDEYNITISGLNSELDLLERVLNKKYICKFIKLHGSTPYHSNKMTNANAILKESIEKLQIKNPFIPVISNINGNILENKKEIKEELLGQLITPVNWKKVTDRAYNDRIDFTVILGAGPGLKNICLKASIESYYYNNRKDRRILCSKIEDLVSEPCQKLSNYIIYIFSSLPIQPDKKLLIKFINELENKHVNLSDCLRKVNLILKNNGIFQNKIEFIDDQIRYLFS